jgi:hypothetical protein
MSIKKVKIPFCDQCGKPWLPDFLLADGTPNPLFEHPENCKRCGKCKSTRWNAAGVDRRRKVVVESPAEIPQVTIDDVRATIDLPEIPKEAFAFLEEVTAQAQVICGGVAASARCRHGLYSCPECHPQEAE